MRKTPESVALLAFELRATLGHGARLICAGSDSLPIQQATVLGHLQRRGAMSTSELAAADRVRPQSMSTTLRALETEGLVERRRHPTDARATLIQPTQKGFGTLERIHTVREGWLNSLIMEEMTDEELDVLRKGLAIIKRIIADQVE